MRYCIKIVTVIFVIAVFILSCKHQQLPGIKVTIDNKANSNDLIDYQVKLNLTFSNFNNSLVARTDGGDIRFNDKNNNQLSYWIENWNPAETTVVWIKVTSIPAKTTTEIYLNPLGDEDAENFSNSDATFEWFKDIWDSTEVSIDIERDTWIYLQKAGDTIGIELQGVGESVFLTKKVIPLDFSNQGWR